MNKKTEEIEKKVSDLLAVPEGAMTGFEEFEQEDYALPRIALCQSMTAQRKATSPTYIEGLNEGMFFNSTTQEVYGKELAFVPIIGFRSQMLFNPMEEGGGIRCRSFNGRDGGSISPTCAACPNYEWTVAAGSGERLKPACMRFYNYVVYTLPGQAVAVLSFKSTGLTTATQWNARMSMLHDKAGRRVPMYGMVWRAKSRSVEKKPYQWYVISLEPAGPTPQSVFQDAVENGPQFQALARRVSLVDDKKIEEEIAAEAETDTASL